jgi:hypothetical protein
MKKLFFILCSFIAVACRAQLPSVVEMGQDSIRITRGELVLRNSTQNIKGFLYNTGGGVTTFKRIEQLNDTTYIFGEDTLRFNASIEGATITTASRGLHKFGNDIRWGITPLDSAVDIDQVGNGITFHDGPFKHVWGDYNQVTQFSIFENGEFGGFLAHGDGAGNATVFQQTVSAPAPVGQWYVTSSDFPLGSIINMHADKLELTQYYGGIYLHGLIDSPQVKGVFIDPDTGLLTMGDAASGSGLSSITADRGLHISAGNIVRWGNTPLDSAVTIDQSGNGITFSDGLFTHGTGDYTDQISPYSLLRDGDAFFISDRFDGDISTQILNTLSTGGQIKLQALKASTSQIGSLIVSPHILNFNQSEGEIYFDGLIDSAQAYVFGFDPGLRKVTYFATPTPGGGSGLTEITADNGLTRSTISNVQLGSSSLGGANLLHTSYIGFNGFQLNLSGDYNGHALDVTNSISSGIVSGIRGVATASTGGIGVRGEGGNIGLSGISTNGTGVLGSSTAGIGGAFVGLIATQAQVNPASTNTFVNISKFLRSSTGTAANGIGGYNSFDIETTDGNIWPAARFGAILSDATTATRTGEFHIWTTSNAVESVVFKLTGIGQMKLPKYIGTTMDGIPTKALGVNASGDVITYAATGGGSPASINFDPTYFDGDGSVGDEITLKHSTVAFITDIDDLDARIDSILGVWPAGSTAGKTQLQNATLPVDGDTLSVKVNDSLFTIKRLKQGANVTFTVDGNSITINSTPGSAEINTLSITLSGTGNLTISVEAILEYVLVNPTTSLAGFKIGTISDDDYYLPAIPIPATALAHELVVQRYIPSSTAIYFSGITSSTEIDLIFKPIHR